VSLYCSPECKLAHCSFSKDIPRTPFLAFIVPFGKTIHDAETFYAVVEGQVVINGVEIIEALFLTYNQFYIILNIK
jgi:hypothetical protein